MSIYLYFISKFSINFNNFASKNNTSKRRTFLTKLSVKICRCMNQNLNLFKVAPSMSSKNKLIMIILANKNPLFP
jgi:hypothetical protein